MNIINPLASALVILSVGTVVMNIVGYMYWWGLNIDSVTVIMLVLALGLSVDYSAHLVRIPPLRTIRRSVQAGRRAPPKHTSHSKSH